MLNELDTLFSTDAKVVYYKALTHLKACYAFEATGTEPTLVMAAKSFLSQLSGRLSRLMQLKWSMYQSGTMHVAWKFRVPLFADWEVVPNERTQLESIHAAATTALGSTENMALYNHRELANKRVLRGPSDWLYSGGAVYRGLDCILYTSAKGTPRPGPVAAEEVVAMWASYFDQLDESFDKGSNDGWMRVLYVQDDSTSTSTTSTPWLLADANGYATAKQLSCFYSMIEDGEVIPVGYQQPAQEESPSWWASLSGGGGKVESSSEDLLQGMLPLLAPSPELGTRLLETNGAALLAKKKQLPFAFSTERLGGLGFVPIPANTPLGNRFKANDTLSFHPRGTSDGNSSSNDYTEAYCTLGVSTAKIRQLVDQLEPVE